MSRGREEEAKDRQGGRAVFVRSCGRTRYKVKVKGLSSGSSKLWVVSEVDNCMEDLGLSFWF
jgi:hypothetical protein